MYLEAQSCTFSLKKIAQNLVQIKEVVCHFIQCPQTYLGSDSVSYPDSLFV